MTPAEREQLIEEIKADRPNCNDPDGHVMITYRTTQTKECAECQHVEPLYVSFDEDHYHA